MVEQNEVTVIGETILVAGSLRGDENLTVLGRVEGEINLTQTLLVDEGGVVKAEVNVQNAVISGIVVGNITATDCIHLTASGKVLGDLCAERLILDPGARVRGAIKVGNRDKARGRDRDRQEHGLQNERGHSLPTSLMARRQLTQSATRAQAQTQNQPSHPLPAAQEAVGGGGSTAPRNNAQEAMAMAVKKKVAGKKRG